MPSARVDSPKDAKDDADRAAVPMGLIATVRNPSAIRRTSGRVEGISDDPVNDE